MLKFSFSENDLFIIYDLHARGKQEISPGLMFSETTKKWCFEKLKKGFGI